MKRKVLIVDDEKLERVLIGKGYAWEDNGFEIIGEASNGFEALELLNIMTPDIIITDINMPYMDGLMLTEEIRKRNYQGRIIIVTGYREFDYARRAIKLGVNDFLLKPVNINDLKEVVESLRDDLIREEKHHREFRSLKEKVSENEDILKQSFMQLLVEGRVTNEEATYKLSSYKLDALTNHCICINIKLHSKKATNHPIIEYINELVCELNMEHKVVVFQHYLSNYILFLMDDNMEEAICIANAIKNAMNEELKIDVVIGISNIESEFCGISKAFKQSEKALTASVIIGTNSIISYDEYGMIKKSNNQVMDINWKDFIFQIENCVLDRVYEYINEYTKNMREAGVTDSTYLRLMTMNMLSKASVVLTKQGMNLGQLIDDDLVYGEVSKIETIKEMNLVLKKLLKEILRYLDSMRGKKRNKLIDEALNYIDKHLFESSLSLKSVANQIFVNESYLSRIFKSEVGESFIEYVTKKRIEESIVLLNTTDLKAYEIADKIGICDPHYFSICFKKYTGVTVKEYKKPITN